MTSMSPQVPMMTAEFIQSDQNGSVAFLERIH